MLQRGGCGAGSGRAPQLPSPQTEPEPHRPVGKAPGRDGLLPFTGVFWSLSTPPRLPAARFSPCQAAFWSLLGWPGTGPGGRLLTAWGSSWGSLHRRVAALMQPGLVQVGLAWASGRGSPACRDFAGAPRGACSLLEHHRHTPQALASSAQTRRGALLECAHFSPKALTEPPAPCAAHQPGPPAHRP